MFTFRKKPVLDIPLFTVIKDDEMRKFCVAVIIEEHGVKNTGTGAYGIKSSIFHKGGYGNLVLDKNARSKEKSGNITGYPLNSMTADSARMTKNLEAKYDISIEGFVRWTGKPDNKTMWDYAILSSFADYERYFIKRFGIEAGFKFDKDIKTKLATYSGNASNYASHVISIYNQIEEVSL